MTHNNKKFFDLLKYSYELEKKNKFLSDEDPEKYFQLIDLLVIIETNFHLRKKDYYLELMNMFLTNKINADSFSFGFSTQYEELNQIHRDMKKDFEKNFDELSNLLVEHEEKKIELSLCDQIGLSLMFMYYNYCDDYDANPEDSYITEEELKNHVKALVGELKQI